MTDTGRALGVCYYPEQWPEEKWEDDARAMAALGLKRVRIGEFAWAKMEPAPGQYDWGWLDRAIATLNAAGLGVVLGTPTATPPKWLVDLYPDILGTDREGHIRHFGSRRHYCFSSLRYRMEAARIVEAIAGRYGASKAIVAWQTDNEYGCHDTARSYSAAARDAFRRWLAQRYEHIEALNVTWGCAFWSQTYRDFEEVDLPNLTVTEPNPSHVLDFYRFASDEVVTFNRMQTDILRRLSPGRPILHNFMGFFFDFDHFALARDLDIAGWDSYPLGFLDVAPFSEDDKRRYLRQGHPDLAAFHHDLYRGVGRGRFEVTEQQPGPVNWARHNPAPLPGMARLWALEAFAHGAETVSYFRWRQAPFAQEQMHAGLERPDGAPSPAYEEVRNAARDIAAFNGSTPLRAAVALVFSYEARWLFEAQPQGAAWSYIGLVYEWYSALRRFGVDIDIVDASADLLLYKLVLAPSLPILGDDFIARVEASRALVLFGPRTGSKTPALTIPPMLAPGALQQLIPLRVTQSESFPATHREEAEWKGAPIAGRHWLDHVETPLHPIVATKDGKGLYFRNDRAAYLTTAPDEAFLAAILRDLLDEIAIDRFALPPDLRVRRTGDRFAAFNYGPSAIVLPANLAAEGTEFLLGSPTLEPAGVAVWRAPSSRAEAEGKTIR